MIILYFLCLIFFLTPICILVSKQLFTIMNHYLLELQFNNTTTKHRNYNLNTINLVCTYIERKLWIKSINLLENTITQDYKPTAEYYNLLGLCYLKMMIYDIAYYHYSQAILEEPNNLMSLFSIGKIYTLTEKKQEAIKIYFKILDIDHNNQIAQQEINILKKEIV